MISFDLECSNKHRFEGVFRDYNAFNEQLGKKMINCPLCNDSDIKRLYTGCSIQSGSSSRDDESRPAQRTPNLFEIIRMAREYITNNFENVGKDFADKARAIHYGIEEERNIYGESTNEEVKELIDEGINVLSLPSVDVDKIEN
jgi:hypothetical protein